VGEPPVARRRLTFRRLTGLDRTGPPPSETRSDAPWRVWTVPNAIGFVRLALVPLFLVVVLASDTGTEPLGPVLFAVAAWGDYADGIAARVTGQYSRFGALLDPIVDRLLIIAGVAACWYHDLLPRWALAVLVARELFMLVAGRIALSRGVELRINWWGRAAVWPVMSAIFFGLCGLRELGAILLYLGVAMALVAAVLYLRDARPSTSA
jgi:CDP-diacylglycerol--glycerol-3-phosphate 3-phosphatidyltransferase